MISSKSCHVKCEITNGFNIITLGEFEWKTLCGIFMYNFLILQTLSADVFGMFLCRDRRKDIWVSLAGPSKTTTFHNLPLIVVSASCLNRSILDWKALSDGIILILCTCLQSYCSGSMSIIWGTNGTKKVCELYLEEERLSNSEEAVNP